MRAAARCLLVAVGSTRCAEDAMATEKLAEGIRKFAADAVTLEKLIRSKIQAHQEAK